VAHITAACQFEEVAEKANYCLRLAQLASRGVFCV
jgi:hypothetical protein